MWDCNHTALHMTIENGDIGLARVLLDAGADPDIRDDKDGATALGWADFFGREEFAKLVREHGGHKWRIRMMRTGFGAAPSPRRHVMIDIESGDPAVDRYLGESYERVRGMSSRFAAAICGHLMRHQTALGVKGDVVEIGTFEGRFFIAMALGLAPAERAIGIDRFDWPDEKIESRFLANCTAHGVTAERFVAWKADSRNTMLMLRVRLGGQTVRFAHIDSHHARECLTMSSSSTPCCIPTASSASTTCSIPATRCWRWRRSTYLARHPEMRLLCIIDREDIVAAPKFLICREAVRPLYEQDSMEAFGRFHFPLNADMEAAIYALAPTPWSRLAEV